MRRFELVEGVSSKFWQVEQDGTDLHIAWGRIGTTGQSQTKSFGDAAAANAAAGKLIDAKTSKGYAEVDACGAAGPVRTAPEPAAASPAGQASPEQAQPEQAQPEQAQPEQAQPEQAQPEQAQPGRAPWADRPYDLTGLAVRRPSRRFPQVLNPSPVPDHDWHTITSTLCSHTLDPRPGRWQQAVAEAEEVRLTGTGAAPSREALLVILGAALAADGNPHLRTETDRGGATRALLGRLGLPAAVGLLLECLGSLSMDYDLERNGRQLTVSALYPVDDLTVATGGEYPGVGLGAVLSEFQHALATAPEAEYAACAERIRAAFDSLSPARRLVLALTVPDEHELSDRLGRDLLSGTAELPAGVFATMLVRSATDPEVIRHAVRENPGFGTLWEEPEFCNTLVREYGADATPRLAPGAREVAAGVALSAIGTPEAMTALVEVASTSKGASDRLTAAVERWPEAGVAALARAVADGRDVTLTAPLLISVLCDDPGLLARVRPFVDGPAQAALDHVAARLNEPAEVAEAADLPPVLASPPWSGKRSKATVPVVSDLAPLPLPDDLLLTGDLREALLAEEDWVLQNAASYQGQPGKALKSFLQCRAQHVPAIATQLKAAGEAAERGDADALVDAWAEHLRLEKEHTGWVSHILDGSEIVHLPHGVGTAVWNRFAGEPDCTSGVAYAAVTLGLAGLPGTVRAVQRHPADHARIALPFRSVHVAPVMARCLLKPRSAHPHGRAWLLAHPEHATAGLIAPALGRKGDAKEAAVTALRLLADHGHRALVEEVAGRYGRDDVSAGVRAVLDLDPLQQLPSRIPPLPVWWQPRTWTRPRLADGKALPEEAVAALGVMFALPRTQGVYPGIALAAQACDPASLAAFGWDAFSAWLSAGAPNKESWAMSTLALIGDDEVARRITPLLRAWPGESQHARAVAGLDVLAGIGTDVALMQLNGIAQKVKFKGLQDKAREKIAKIAEDREMTTEELADRLAPDLGLDERGTLVLDFGPRQFTVGFDESLAPFVRDGDGARLKDLPKPRASDDADAGKAATTTWRQLKKDARTVAAQQMFRFELAMTNRRRWTPETFTELIVRHPLVGHVASRLVWGQYAPDPDHPGLGGQLRGVFRVAEDASFTDALDEEIELGAGPAVGGLAVGGLAVGVVHPLELPAQDAAAMGQLFADYEIAQPFPQLGRDTYTLTADELQATELKRWANRGFPTARLLGLTNRGWRRGTPQDAGWVWNYTRDLGDGRIAQFNLDPGVVVGAPEFEPVQNGVSLVFGPARWEEVSQAEVFAGLHPVTVSELIREAEILTQEAGS